MNAIEIYLCPEDRARLDKLTSKLDAYIAARARLGITDSFADGEPTVPPYSAPDMPMPDPAPVTPAEAEAPKAEPVTMDQVQAAVRQLIKPGSPHRDAAKEIVQEYAPKVSAIPEEKLAEVFGRLSELNRGVA